MTHRCLKGLNLGNMLRKVVSDFVKHVAQSHMGLWVPLNFMKHAAQGHTGRIRFWATCCPKSYQILHIVVYCILIEIRNFSQAINRRTDRRMD